MAYIIIASIILCGCTTQEPLVIKPPVQRAYSHSAKSGNVGLQDYSDIHRQAEIDQLRDEVRRLKRQQGASMMPCEYALAGPCMQW